MPWHPSLQRTGVHAVPILVAMPCNAVLPPFIARRREERSRQDARSRTSPLCTLQVALDDSPSHSTSAVLAWLEKNPRITSTTLTCASWLNRVGWCSVSDSGPSVRVNGNSRRRARAGFCFAARL